MFHTIINYLNKLDKFAKFYKDDERYITYSKPGRDQLQRIIAFLLLLIPGLFTALGIKWMRDMLFGRLSPMLPALWIQFLLGLLFFIGGLAFIAGFILHRDRKRNKVQQRFSEKSVRK